MKVFPENKLEYIIECPFNEETSIFGPLKVMVPFRNGEIMAHDFGNEWKLTVDEKKFSKFAYTKFILTEVSDDPRTIEAGYNPEVVEEILLNIYHRPIQDFLFRVAKHFDYEPESCRGASYDENGRRITRNYISLKLGRGSFTLQRRMARHPRVNKPKTPYERLSSSMPDLRNLSPRTGR